MKKIITLISTLVISSGIFAQSKFSIGPSGGFGHAFITPYSDAQFKPSWNVGLTSIYSPVEHWGIGIDAKFSQEGSKVKVGENSADLTLNYFRLPLKGYYFFKPYADNFRPKISLGPCLGILSDDQKSTSTHTKVDFGVTGAIGFNYRLADEVWLDIDAAYYQGFVDLYKGDADKQLNGNITLNAGIIFGF